MGAEQEGMVNEGRRIVLHVHAKDQEDEEEVEDEEDEEYDLGEDEEVRSAPTRWMTIARYYSGQEYKTWVLFNELSKVWGKAYRSRYVIWVRIDS